MKYIGKILICIFLIGLTSCEPDVVFSDIAPNVASDVNYMFPDSVSIVVGNDGLATINGKDSCFVELIDGEDVVELNTLYSIGDKYFYGGITSYVTIHSLSEGVAHCRLFNTKFEFDTTISIIVSSGTTPGIEPTPDAPYVWSSWFSTSLESDSIILFVGDYGRAFQIHCEIEGLSVVNDDDFIAKLYNTGSLIVSGYGSYSYTGKYSIAPEHVGNTTLHISAQGNSSIVKVTVLGEYYTYTEPGLDFDDTEDSVRAKLLKTFSLYTYNPAEHYYQVEDSRCRYNLYVNYANNGTVDNYIVDLYQGVSSDELVGYVAERYYKTTAYSNGLPVYIKAFNVSSPSISDASVVVIPNNASHKVTYKNPMTYSN